MPTPNHPKLPLCSAFAAEPARYLFANWLKSLCMDQPQEALEVDAIRLKGMLIAYLELDLISFEHYHTFAFGTTA